MMQKKIDAKLFLLLMIWLITSLVASCSLLNGGKTGGFHDIRPEELLPYDKPPQPVGGWAVIQKYLVYPAEYPAQGKTGKVLITAKIDVDGSLLHPEVTKSLGSEYDEAAMEALERVKFTPAMAHGEPVAVWITIPVVFKQP